jgi:hypothetical protein
MSFDYFIAYFSTSTVLLPFVLCLIARAKKKVGHITNLLLVLFIISLTSSIIFLICIKTGRRSLFFFNIYTPLEFLMISQVYRFLLEQYKRMIDVFRVLYVAFFIADCLYIEPIVTVQDYPITLESILVLFFSLLHVFYLNKSLQHEPSVLRNGTFWLTVAFIVYFTYDIALFFMAKEILVKLQPAVARQVWSFHNLNYMIRNLLLTLALYYMSKEEKGIDFKKYGEQENWRNKMKPNPNLSDKTSKTG